MQLANSSVLAGLVLFFLAAHFLLLAGILIRIVLTHWRLMLRARNQSILLPSSNRSVSKLRDEVTTDEANRMQLL